jgi:hypothetical protein
MVQLLREAFLLQCPYCHVVFDRDRKFGADVVAFLKDSGLKAVRTRSMSLLRAAAFAAVPGLSFAWRVNLPVP